VVGSTERPNASKASAPKRGSGKSRIEAKTIASLPSPSIDMAAISASTSLYVPDLPLLA